MRDVGRFVKRGLGLIPANSPARVIMSKLDEGQGAFLELWLPRNMAFHRRYFALLNRVVQACDEWPSVEALSFDIMLALKRGTYIVAKDGSSHFRPDSRAVASMPKAEFERLYEDTMALLTKWLGADPEMLLEDAA